jgi:hypothetical protein
MTSRRNVSALPIMAVWVAVLFSSAQCHQVAANGFPRDVVEDEDLHFDINSSKPQIRHFGRIHAGSTMAKVTKFQSESDDIQKRLVAYDLDPILPPYDKVYEQLVVKLEEKVKDEDENETSTLEEEQESFGDSSAVEGQIDDKQAEERDKNEIAGIVESANDVILEERDLMKIQVDDEQSEEGDSIEKSTDDANDTNGNDTSELTSAEENDGDVITIIDEELEEVESLEGEAESSEEGIITSLQSEPLISSEFKTDAVESSIESNDAIDESSTGEESSEDASIETQESPDESKESSDELVSADEISIDAEAKEESEEIVDTVDEEELDSGEVTDTSDVEKSEDYQQEGVIESLADPPKVVPESDTNGSEEPSTDYEVAGDSVETLDSNVEEVAISEISATEEGTPQEEEETVDPISSIVQEDLDSLEIGDETGVGDNEEEEEVTIEIKEIAADASADNTVIVEDNAIEDVGTNTSASNEVHQEAERVDHDTDIHIEAIETDKYDGLADNIDSNEGEDTPVVVDANVEEPVEGSDQITSASHLEQAEDVKDNADVKKHEEEIIDDGLEQSEEAEIDGNVYNYEELVIDMNVQQSEEEIPDAVDAAEIVDSNSLVDSTSEEEVEATEVTEAQSDNSEAPTDYESINDEEPALDESNVEEIESSPVIYEEEPGEEAAPEDATGTSSSVDSESGQDELSEDSQDLEGASTIIGNDGDTDDTEIEMNEQEPQQIPSIPKPTANEQFVNGLDDLYKIFEEVDPPDELDVGASGLSMEEVFKQQGVTIIKMRVQKGVEQVKKSLATLKKKGRKQWSTFKEALDDKFDFNVDEMAVSVVERLEEPYQKTKVFFSENRGKFDGLTKALDKVVTKAKSILSRIGIIDSDDDYDYDDEDDDSSFEGLQINDDDRAEMRKKLMERYS